MRQTSKSECGKIKMLFAPKSPTTSILLLAAILLFVYAFAACSTESAKRTHLTRGENFLKNRDYQNAANEFRSAIELDRTFAPAHFGLARAYEAQERFAEAVEELRKAVEFDSKHIEARLKLGNYFLLMVPPQTNEAEKMVEQILAINANYIEGHILKASAAAVAKKPETEVLKILNHAVSLEPNRVETFLSIGRFYMSRENPAEAEKYFQKALQINQNSVAAHIDYGRFLDYSDRTTEAEAGYRRAVEIEPQNREALETLAAFYVVRKQIERAEEIYRQIVNLTPDKPEEKLILADFYAAVNREADAIKVFEEILSARPEFIKARARFGELHLQRNDEAGANTQANEILKRNGRDPAGLMLRARIRLRNGDAETAIKNLQDVLKQEPSNKLALYFMADAQLRAGNIEQARNFIGELKRFHPTYYFADQFEINISLADNQPETALKQATALAEKLRAAKPNRNISEREIGDLRLSSLISRATANLQMGRTDAARADLTAAQTLAPNAPAVYLNFAKVALKSQNLAEAVDFYNRALALDANNFDALSGLINTKSLQKQFNEAHAAVDAKLNAPGDATTRAAYFFLKSQIFTAERRQAEAEIALQNAIREDAGYLPAYVSYAALLSSQNKTDLAIEQYRVALSKNPNDANVYTLIGLLEDGRGNFDAAVENYKKALKINPNQAIAANNVSWIYAEHGKGNLDEAAALVQKLTEKFPNEAGYADTLGWVFHKKGAYEMAVAQFRRAVALDEKAATNANRQPNAAYRMRLGAALAAVGDKQSARREVENALQNPRAMSQGEIEQAKNLLATLN